MLQNKVLLRQGQGLLRLWRVPSNLALAAPRLLWPASSLLLEQFAKHYETGETLPGELFDKLCAQRTYMAGSAMLRQLYFGQVCFSLAFWTCSEIFCLNIGVFW